MFLDVLRELENRQLCLDMIDMFGQPKVGFSNDEAAVLSLLVNASLIPVLLSWLIQVIGDLLTPAIIIMERHFPLLLLVLGRLSFIVSMASQECKSVQYSEHSQRHENRLA